MYEMSPNYLDSSEASGGVLSLVVRSAFPSWGAGESAPWTAVPVGSKKQGNNVVLESISICRLKHLIVIEKRPGSG